MEDNTIDANRTHREGSRRWYIEWCDKNAHSVPTFPTTDAARAAFAANIPPHLPQYAQDTMRKALSGELHMVPMPVMVKTLYDLILYYTRPRKYIVTRIDTNDDPPNIPVNNSLECPDDQGSLSEIDEILAKDTPDLPDFPSYGNLHEDD